MTKSDAALNEIDTVRAKKDLRKPSWLTKPIVAFDTETADGEVFMISRAGPHGSTALDNGDGSVLDPGRVWRMITARRNRDTLNVWYNLGFDAEVILSALDRDAAEVLHTTCNVTAEVAGTEYEITYIPGKFLRVDTTADGRNAVEHFDVSTFFRASLADAASEWLNGPGKITDGPDTSRFGDADYRESMIGEIREYAKRDAEVTRDLAEAFGEVAEGEVNVPFGRPVSTGYLAAEYLRSRLDKKPGWGLNAVQSMAWDSYAGGRFEVFERGSVGEVAGPDINSAYPAVMANLPDPGTVSWRIEADPDPADVIEADWGFIEGTFWTDPEARIQPFPIKRDGLVTYPSLNGVSTTVTLPEYRLAREIGLIERADLSRAGLGRETDATRFPFRFIEDLYATRKEWEREGRYLAATVLKIVLNSMYGKTAQTTLRRSIPDGPVNADGLDPVERIGNAFGRALVERLDSGELFNPVLASYITAETRTELHRAVYETDLIEDTVLFATDCIMVDSEAYERSSFDDRLGDTLGEWDFDYRGDAFVVGSGVYEVATESGLKTSTRGFRDADLGSDGLRGAAEAADGPIPISQDRPTTLGEALTRPDSFGLSDVGRFRTADRGLDPTFDRKREWPSAEWSDLLNGSQTSRPIRLG